MSDQISPTNSSATQYNISKSLIEFMHGEQSCQVYTKQEYFLITVDAVKVFLHQREAEFGVGPRLLAWAGIFITILLTLLTANFTDSFGITKEYISSFFSLSCLMVFILFMKDLFVYIKVRSRLGIEKMAEDLGKKGAIISANTKNIVEN